MQISLIVLDMHYAFRSWREALFEDCVQTCVHDECSAQTLPVLPKYEWRKAPRVGKRW